MSYTPFTWHQDDDLTSASFQQMSDNQDWTKAHILWQPQVIYQGSPSGYNDLRGRLPVPDISSARTPIALAGIFTAYDSVKSYTEFEVIVPIPAGFVKPPVFSVSVATGTLQEVAYISQDYSTTEMRVHLFYRDGLARPFSGALHVLALGAGTVDSTYSPVLWQTDDEVTFDKLQQMNANNQYVHDNTLLSPEILYQVTPSSPGDTDLRGRPAGLHTASKIVGIFTAYDSAAALVDFEVIIPLPAGVFTYAPIYSVAVATGTLQEVAYITDDSLTTQLKVHLFYRDGVARFFSGVIHCLALGY